MKKATFFKLVNKALKKRKPNGWEKHPQITSALSLDHRHWVPEHRFHPTRKWRFDYAWVAGKVGIEVDGGIWKGAYGGHTSGTGKMRDMEKDAEAQMLGWKVFRFAPNEGERLRGILARLPDAV